DNFNESLVKLEKAGYELVDIALPYIDYSIPVYYVIVPAEVSSNMARYDGVKFGAKVEGDNLTEDYFKTRGRLIGREVKRRILIGTYVLSSGYYDSYYGKATKIRELIKRDFTEAFKLVDAIVMPSTANPAFKIGEKVNDPIAMYLEDMFTSPADLAGIPAISVPSGKTEKGLPLAIQFIGKFADDLTVLDLTTRFEKL
ncbi:MAG TPA: amidase family protein, partial [Candidatus Paceibacterota bacterium]|nr:amidase family protein [Candidatus Paceibacterota bacterium]